jgi:hypothetical protein
VDVAEERALRLHQARNEVDVAAAQRPVAVERLSTASRTVRPRTEVGTRSV